MFKNWGNRDWVWTVSLLILIMIVLIADLFNFPNIEANFSIIASAVSIALAIVAISFAFKQDSDSKRESDRIVDLMKGIHIDIRDVGARLDPKDVDNLTSASVEDASESFEEKESYTKEEVDNMINEVRKNIIANFNEHIVQNEDDIKVKYNSRYRDESALKVVKRIIRENKHKTNEEIIELLQEKYGIRTTRSMISRLRNNL